MTENANTQSCHLFQAQLSELIGSGEDLAAHPHLLQCPRCQALLAELETIAQAARQLFPVVDPPDKLWTQIESALRNEKQMPEAD
jgi:hypothetical protein